MMVEFNDSSSNLCLFVEKRLYTSELSKGPNLTLSSDLTRGVMAHWKTEADAKLGSLLKRRQSGDATELVSRNLLTSHISRFFLLMFLLKTEGKTH